MHFTVSHTLIINQIPGNVQFSFQWNDLKQEFTCINLLIDCFIKEGKIWNAHFSLNIKTHNYTFLSRIDQFMGNNAGNHSAKFCTKTLMQA